MGQRFDAFSDVFDGTYINWDALLGSGFHSAPRHWVSVYRECSPAELYRVAREGLSAPAAEARHPELRHEMELLDRFRPEHIERIGVSRLGAIYAAPTPETPRLRYRTERVVIEMLVDPAHGFVGDMDFITGLIPFINAYRQDIDKYQGAFKKYWESIVQLTDFLRYYIKEETVRGAHWYARAGAPARLPRTFFAPEILLMTPVISQRHVRIVQDESSCCEFHDSDDDGSAYGAFEAAA